MASVRCHPAARLRSNLCDGWCCSCCHQRLRGSSEHAQCAQASWNPTNPHRWTIQRLCKTPLSMRHWNPSPTEDKMNCTETSTHVLHSKLQWVKCRSYIFADWHLKLHIVHKYHGGWYEHEYKTKNFFSTLTRNHISWLHPIIKKEQLAMTSPKVKRSKKRAKYSQNVLMWKYDNMGEGTRVQGISVGGKFSALAQRQWAGKRPVPKKFTGSIPAQSMISCRCHESWCHDSWYHKVSARQILKLCYIGW